MDRTAPGEGALAGGEAPEVAVDLRDEFYPPEAVQRAAGAFERVAELTLERRGPCTRVRIRARGGADPVLIGRELANWVLAAAAVASAP